MLPWSIIPVRGAARGRRRSAEGPGLLRAAGPRAGLCGVRGGGREGRGERERCCVILSTLHSGSSHETDTFCLLCSVSIGRRSGYCCRKLLLFLCSVDQLFSPQPPAEIQRLPPSLPLSLLASLSHACRLSIWKSKEKADHGSSV